MNPDDVKRVRIIMHRMQVALEEQTNILDAVEQLHEAHAEWENSCAECFQPWPCRTARVLYGDEIKWLDDEE